LNLIRVMPAKGQDMPTVASPRISLFLARLLGPVFVTIAIGVLVNGAVFRAIAEESLRSHALIYLTGLFAITAGVAILLNHNVWAADWRVLITLFGWLAAIGGAQRIIWPQATEIAVRWFLANPTSLVVAGIVWLVIGAVLCFYGYFRESAPGATR
jgi:heme/copper-type cytochrome/quinol oxidase subunit 2